MVIYDGGNLTAETIFTARHTNVLNVHGTQSSFTDPFSLFKILKVSQHG